MDNNIDWEELKKKVDMDLQKQIDEEVSNVNSIREIEGKDGIIDLSPKTRFENAFDELFVDPDKDSEEEIDEDIDYFDEGGEIPDILALADKEISNIAWNNKDKIIHPRNPFWGPKGEQVIFNPKAIDDEIKRLQIKLGDCVDCDKCIDCNNKKETYSIECKHMAEESADLDENYIYDLGIDQEICLCKQCNMILASKILEQLALETFIK